jgi:nitroimidazol reductase NimA-like FMN-containing flavoprotein (pyridoxamine 5'-phosphate oxidase superfamily)
MTPNSAPSRTRVTREPHLGIYDRDTIYQILDEGFICHVCFVEHGQPFGIPTSYGRVDDQLYIHGSSASRMLRTLGAAAPICVNVTLLDGLVLARSVFNHSMNYRSVVILGTAELVLDATEKLRALEALSEHIVPGRWQQSRPPNDRELKATSVLRVALNECSAKVRTGPPIDDEEDYSLDVWAGEIPLRLVPGTPIPDPKLPTNMTVPSNVQTYSRSR